MLWFVRLLCLCLFLFFYVHVGLCSIVASGTIWWQWLRSFWEKKANSQLDPGQNFGRRKQGLDREKQGLSHKKQWLGCGDQGLWPRSRCGLWHWNQSWFRLGCWPRSRCGPGCWFQSWHGHECWPRPSQGLTMASLGCHGRKVFCLQWHIYAYRTTGNGPQGQALVQALVQTLVLLLTLM